MARKSDTERDPCEDGPPANVEIEFHIACSSADNGAKGGLPSGGLDQPARVCYSFKLPEMTSEYHNCVDLKGSKPPPGDDTAVLMQKIADQLGEARRGSQIPNSPKQAAVMFQKYNSVQTRDGQKRDIEVQNGKIVLLGASCADAYADYGKVNFGLFIEGSDPGFVIGKPPEHIPQGYRGSDAKGAEGAERNPKPKESELRRRTNRFWKPDEPGIEVQPGEPRVEIRYSPAERAIGTIRLICQTNQVEASDGIGSVLVPFQYRSELGEQRMEILERMSSAGVRLDLRGDWIFPVETADGRLIKALKFATAYDPTGTLGAFPWHVYVGNRNPAVTRRHQVQVAHLAEPTFRVSSLASVVVDPSPYDPVRALFSSFVVPEAVEGRVVVAQRSSVVQVAPVPGSPCADCSASVVPNNTKVPR